MKAFNAQQPATPPKGSKAPKQQSDDHPDVAKVRDSLRFYPNTDLHYDEWFKVGAALNSWDSGQTGLDLWLEWSRQSSKHVEGECEKTWSNLSPEKGITIATLFGLAKDNGWEQSPKATIGPMSIAATQAQPRQFREGEKTHDVGHAGLEHGGDCRKSRHPDGGLAEAG